MKWEVSLEVGSMAYSTNSYLKMQISTCFWIWNEWYLLRRNNTRFYVDLGVGVGSMPEIALSRVTFERKLRQVWGPNDLDLSLLQYLWGFCSGTWELNRICAVANIVQSWVILTCKRLWLWSRPLKFEPHARWNRILISHLLFSLLFFFSERILLFARKCDQWLETSRPFLK
jgi:hypothetical protein